VLHVCATGLGNTASATSDRLSLRHYAGDAPLSNAFAIVQKHFQLAFYGVQRRIDLHNSCQAAGQGPCAPLSSIQCCPIALGGLAAGPRGRDGRLGTVDDVNVLNRGSFVW
jgi:hypothetical protein